LEVEFGKSFEVKINKNWDCLEIKKKGENMQLAIWASNGRLCAGTPPMEFKKINNLVVRA